MAQIQELFVDGIGKIHFVGGMIHLEFMRYIPVADGKAPLQQCTFRLIMPMHGFLDSINSMQDLMMRLLEFGIFHKESAYPPLRLLKNDPEEDNANEANSNNESPNQQDIRQDDVKQNINSNQDDIKQNKEPEENFIQEENILKFQPQQQVTEQRDRANSEPVSQNVPKQEIVQERKENLVKEKNVAELKPQQQVTEQRDRANSEPVSQNEEVHSKDKKSKGLFGWLKKK